MFPLSVKDICNERKTNCQGLHEIELYEGLQRYLIAKFFEKAFDFVPDPEVSRTYF